MPARWALPSSIPARAAACSEASVTSSDPPMGAAPRPAADAATAEPYLAPKVRHGPVLPSVRSRSLVEGWGLGASAAVHAAVLTAVLLTQLPSPPEGPAVLEIP